MYVDGLSDEEVKALRIADNKLNESAWDLKTLAAEIEGLDFGNIELEFDLGEKPKVREDNYEPVVPEEPKAKLGQVYLLGRHRLMCGDSTKLSDVEKLMAGEKADMLLTDPPYGIDYEGKTAEALKIENDKLSDETFRQFLIDAFTSALAVMKPGAAFHIWYASSKGYVFETAARDAGLLVRQVLIWVKDRFTLSRQDFHWQHEPCLYGEKMFPAEEAEYDGHENCMYGWASGAGHYFFKNRKQSTVMYFDRPTASREHPTMKPILLFDYEMKCNSLVDEIVLDLFGGSGTTIMAAEQNGRRAFVMEFDPRFVDVIIDRWEKFTGQTAVLVEE